MMLKYLPDLQWHATETERKNIGDDPLACLKCVGSLTRPLAVGVSTMEVPDSCKPFEGIHDLGTRITQVESTIDQIKTAIAGSSHLGPAAAAALAPVRRRLQEMESYLQSLKAATSGALNVAGTHIVPSPTFGSGSDSDGGGDEEELVPAVPAVDVEAAAPSVLSNVSTVVADPGEDSDDLNWQQYLPHIELDFDDEGNPIAPPSCQVYTQCLLPGSDKGAFVATMNPTIENYKNAVRNIVKASKKYPPILESESTKTTFRMCAEMIEFFGSLAPRDSVKAALEALEATKVYNQELLDLHNSLEGSAAEKSVKLSRACTQSVRNRDPYQNMLAQRYNDLVECCLQYGPPEFDTKVFASSASDGEGSVPILRHFVASYPGGVEGLAQDLQSGGYSAMVTREMCTKCRELVTEVCSIANYDWGPTRLAVLLVGTLIASSPPATYATEMAVSESQSYDFAAHANDNFVATKLVVRNALERITAGLVELEASMQESGDLARLAALVAPKRTKPETDVAPRLRQDNVDMLGRHPQFLRLKYAFERLPSGYPGHSKEMLRQHALYLWTEPPTLVEEFDPDIQHMIRGLLDLQGTVAEMYERNAFMANQARTCRVAESCVAQPYVLWLLQVARRVAPHFHARMTELFGNQYQSAPIKGFLRCSEKVREKYSPLDLPMPSGAHLLDVVRGIVRCSTVKEMEDTFRAVCANFDVLRVKNGFAEPEVEYGFRQILINIRFAPQQKGALPDSCAMVCELQLNLDAYVDVKHKIHRYYSILRCEQKEGLGQLLRKRAHPF